MILARHYLTWVTISTHSAIQANNRDPEVSTCIQQRTGPTAFVSGILCESYDEQNDSLAYIINEDNVKYFPPAACPQRQETRTVTKLLKAYAIY